MQIMEFRQPEFHWEKKSGDREEERKFVYLVIYIRIWMHILNKATAFI